MQATSKHYINQFLNADDEPNLLKEGEAVNIVNLRFGTTEAGAAGRWEAINSNEELTLAGLHSSSICLRAISEETLNSVIYFLYSTESSVKGRIVLYYAPTGTFYNVLTGLDFSKDKLIDACVINGLLYWTDGYNQPCRINLGAAIKYHHGTSPIESAWAFSNVMVDSDYSLIRKAPSFTPTIEKVADGAFANNFIKTTALKFGFQYVYYDGEISVVGPLSLTSGINDPNDPAEYNCVRVKLPITEVIRESVKTVRIVALFEASDTAFVVKEWERTDSAVEQHNLGIVPLAFSFYNERLGQAIDRKEFYTPFHNVPNTCKTLELIRNRLFLGNGTYGYDTPTSTSLTLSLATGTTTSSALTIYLCKVSYWYQWDVNDPIITEYAAFYAVNTTSNGNTGYHLVNGTLAYSSTAYPTLAAPPATITQANLTYGGSPNDIVSNDLFAYGTFNPYSFSFAGNPIITGSGAVSLNGQTTSSAKRVFKSMSSYQLGVVFFDAYRRKCGVVTNETLKKTIAPRTSAYTLGYTTGINWQLTSDPAVAANEIPSWATHYAVVMTRSLKTRNFIQGRSVNALYITKDANGDYDYTNVAPNQCTAIAIDISDLEKNNVGYRWEEESGDMCALTTADDLTHELPVIGQDGKYVIVSPKDIGALFGVIYEFYTPYRGAGDEPFFEMGEVCEVVRPTLSTVEYGTLAGTIQPDTCVVERTASGTTFYAEAMSPNDKIQRWFTNHGFPTIVTKEGRKHLPTSVAFSDVYVPGTKTNGLSAFQALNMELLPYEMGSIQKLQNTSKVEGEGNVLLAIGENETASLYIGEAQLSDVSGSSIFIKSDGVIGQVNTMKGSYGTVNPESVVPYNGNVYWFSARRGAFVEYSVNGLDELSGGELGKFRRVAAALGKKYLSLSASDIEALGSRPFIFGGVDPKHNELYWTVPRLSATAPKGTLTDYVSSTPAYVTSTKYPYDILDYEGKTLVFKIGGRWMGAYSWTPEAFTSLSNTLYSLKSGKLFRHGVEGSYNNFYSVQCRSKIMFCCNTANMVKEFKTLAVEASQAPEWVHLRTESPYEQSSDLIASDFSQKEGIYYADLYRDRLTPGAESYDKAQLTGDMLRGQVLLVCLQFTGNAWFRTATIGYNQSTGHY